MTLSFLQIIIIFSLKTFYKFERFDYLILLF